jgi:hypothetical protein
MTEDAGVEFIAENGGGAGGAPEGWGWPVTRPEFALNA